MNNLMELQRTLRNQGVLISFSGRFSQEIIEELGEAVKKHLESEAAQNLIFNVFSVFIEQTQNIKSYAASREGRPGSDAIAASGIVTIGKSPAGYFVSSGNLVHKDDAVNLARQLDTLVALEKLELKKLYKEQMKKELPPGSTSAGLGLIDMAKKASRPLEFSLVDHDANLAFFTLLVYV